MKIGILQCDHVPDRLLDRHGDHDRHFVELLSDDRFEFVTYPVVDGVFPQSPGAAQGWIITGGRNSVSDPLDWIARLKRFVREVHDAGIPMIGVCFGHQVIAAALGGAVGRLEAGRTAGPLRYRWTGERDDEVALFYHQEEVISLPDTARVIGTADHCRHAFIRYGDTILTSQAHPEFQPDFLAELIELTEAQGSVLPGPMQDAVQRTRQFSSGAAALAAEMKEHFLRNDTAGQVAR